MKHRLAVVVCTLTMAAAASAQSPAPKPSAATLLAEATAPQTLESRASTLAPVAPSTLPGGTAIRISLDRTLSTSANRVGDRFVSRVMTAVVVNGRTAIPVGSSLVGIIDGKSEPRRFAGRPSLSLRSEKIVLPDGLVLALDATVVDTSTPSQVKVNDEGRLVGPTTSRNDKMESVALTATGAVAGGVIAGPIGSLIGAGVGATTSLGHYLTKRHSFELPAGTVLILELNAPLPLASAKMTEDGH